MKLILLVNTSPVALSVSVKVIVLPGSPAAEGIKSAEELGVPIEIPDSPSPVNVAV